ncbi:MAG: flagellar filament capping protein FliD [Gammaproteobacteria bacterium]|nr:lateral flagellar hook-associated protein 2 [Gammaproteobacteria bacterium]
MTDFDPVLTAQQLAAAYVQSAQAQLNASQKTIERTSTGLSSLRSALSAFDSALASLSSNTNGLRQFSTTVSVPDIANASASSRAQPGTYSFHVEQLATAHQLVFEGLPAVPVAMGGPLVVQLADGSSFIVNLLEADTNNDGTISQAEIARAINQAENNQGKVTASLVTLEGSTKLLLTAGATGEANAISLDTSGLAPGDLKNALDAGEELVAARDAIIWLGGQGGIEIRQSSNTLTAIEGVSITFTRAMAADEAPLTITVSADKSGTADNVQKFVDAYNKLKSALDSLTKVSTDASVAPGAFATDAGVRALRNTLTSILRQEFGGLTLVDLGIKATRDGTLSLDRDKLEKTLAANPSALDDFFGKASLTAPSGLLGALDRYLDAWLRTGTGHLASRQASLEIQQKRLNERQARVDAQYEQAYIRYLQQFTQLQALQAQMNQTSGLFAALGVG